MGRQNRTEISARQSQPSEDLRPTCQSCGEARFRTLVSAAAFRIDECLSCRLAYTTPADFVVQSHYDDSPDLAAGYSKKERALRRYSRSFLTSIRKHVARGRLLDVGCSIGTLVEEARKLGFEAEGIDLDRNAIAYGRKQERELHCSRLEDWSHGSYDVICMSHTLEHVRQPQPLLRECMSRLTSGGCLALVLPCHTGLHPRLFKGRWYGWQPGQHYLHYSIPAISGLFEQQGLELVEVTLESMDHRPQREYMTSLKAMLKCFASYCLATIGAAVAQGDQLVVIGRAP